METYMKLLKLIITMLLALGVQSIYADDTAVFKRKCGVCHTLDNVSNGKIGPNLTHLAAKRPEEYIRAYMKNPGDAKKKFPEIFEKETKGKYSSVMPTTKVTDEEAEAILRALK